MLLEAGANINAEDHYSQTPTAVATDPQIKKLLKEAGGKVIDGAEAGMDRSVSAPVSPARSRNASQSPMSRSPSPKGHRSPSPRGGK